MSLQGWEELVCYHCGSPKFTQLVGLSWKEGQGTTTRPAGYMCKDCGTAIDMAKIITKVREKHIARQIAELEANRG